MAQLRSSLILVALVSIVVGLGADRIPLSFADDEEGVGAGSQPPQTTPPPYSRSW